MKMESTVNSLGYWRIKAHEAIDPIWKSRRFITRSEVYQMLNDEFGKEIHIGESDIEQCKKIIKFINNK